MRFECTLARSPDPGTRPGEDGDCVELTISAPPGCSGLELQDAVSRKYGTLALTAGGSPIAGMIVGVPPLVSGVVLVDGTISPPFSRNPERSSSGLMLAIHGGPGAGAVVPLGRGSVRIGRSGTEILIADAEMSREHARLEVSEANVTITDLGSVNGTTVDDKRVKSSPVSTDSVIRCGHSTLSIVFGGSLTEQRIDAAAAGSNVAEPLIVGRKAETGSRGTLILSAGLPIAIGVGLALITGMWMFLAFTAVSAVSVLVPLMSGRSQRRELQRAVHAAVKEDQDRRRRSAPSAADLVLQTRFSSPQVMPAPVGNDGIWLRLGLATQPANVRTDPIDPGFRPPLLEAVAVRLEPGPGTRRVQGPDEAVAGLVRSVIMQLAAFPLGSGTRVLILGAARELPLAARFLAQVSLMTGAAACLARLSDGPGQGFLHGVLIILEDIRCSGDIDTVVSVAVTNGWQVFQCSGAGSELSKDMDGPHIDLSGGMARLTSAAGSFDFVADRVSAVVFDNFCRQLASSQPRDNAARQRVPETCSLGDVLTLSDAELARRWDESRGKPGLPVSLGVGAFGPRLFDLQADGPHLLVAGTTGSGKSELLRSLTVSLALSFPPERVNFLFVDFKGGSGLGPLTGLPHCVGLLTDLSQHELHRFLVSMRAEIRRREELLARAETPDLASYRAATTGKMQDLPHLVLVIDEFRMLVEDAPEALRELMRIAAIGRSLGLHLIMATQRPQGAITADIRANVTTSIALRVQSELESADIINSGAAARIPVGHPGRAFLARGTDPPEEFQTAALTGTTAPVGCDLTVATTLDVLAAPGSVPGQRDTAKVSITPADAAAPLIRQACSLWTNLGGAPVRAPVMPALPEFLPFPGPDPGCLVELGWVDFPEQQIVTALKWDPSVDGHLGLVGTTSAGTDDAMHLILRQMLEIPREAHFYVLDSAGSLSEMSELPYVGAVAGVHELRRGVRVLERVAHEMSVRLSNQGDGADPPLILVVSGWGSWVSALRAGPLVWAEDLLENIVRDGMKANVTVLISGDRELVTARFFSSLPNRCFFPTGSSEEGRLAWPRLPAVPPVKGRAIAFGSLVKGSPSMVQFFAPPENALRLQAPVPTPKTTPFRVERLPVSVDGRAIRDRYEAAASRRSAPTGPAPRRRNHTLLIGVGGDELEPITLDLPKGGVLAVLGGPSAGKSTFLQALPEMNPGEAAWLCPERDADLGSYWSSLAAEATSGGLTPGAIALVDDADRLSPAAHNSLLDLNTLGVTIILAAGFSSTIAQRVPLMLQARSHGSGVLICPRSVLDGDFFGVRFDLEARPPAGRAAVISGGNAVLTQLGALAPRL